MTFYERFSELCEERGTTPNRVCTVVGLSGSSASVWKKRGSRPKDETLKDIADFLDTTPEYLLGYSDVKSKREEWEKRLQDAQYRVHFDRVLARLGMDGRGLTPYSCRHTTATMFAMKVDPNTLKELMRHSSIDMQEHYKHTTAQEVLDKINELALWH